MAIKVKKAVVVGAGIMGASIAAHLTGAGISVTLLDIVPTALTADEKNKALTLSDKVVRNRIVMAGYNRVMDPKNKIVYSKNTGKLLKAGNLEDDMDCFKDADWVVEAIIEQLGPKQALFGKVSQIVPSHCILSSNSSGISMNAIAEGVSPEMRSRFLGTHFFNPPRVMKLLELIPTQYTDGELFKEFQSFSRERLGKTVVVAKDTPNFIANRIGVCNTSLAVGGLAKFNLSVETVDYLSGPLLQRATGVLKMCDLVGLDIIKATMITNRNAESTPEEASIMAVPSYFDEMLEKGALGNKSGGGFYRRVSVPKRETLMWDIQKKAYVAKTEKAPDAVAALGKKASVQEKVLAVLDTNGEESKFLWYLLKNLFCYSANRATEIADDFRSIDLAMQLGYNWQLGPFQLWDAIGAEIINKRLAEEGVQLPAWVEERLKENNGRFYGPEGFMGIMPPTIHIREQKYATVFESEDWLLKDMGDGIGCLLVNSPHSTVTVPGSREMLKVLDIAQELFQGLVLANDRKNFCVGADLNDFIQYYDSEKWDEMGKNVRDFHIMTRAVKFCKIPVVAAAFGNVLGGGAELCMHAHRVVAHIELRMGLVESKIGLVPAGGGLKELTLQAMEMAAKWPGLDVQPVLEKLAFTAIKGKVSTSAWDAKELGLLKETDRIVLNKEMLLAEAKREALHMAKHFVPVIEKAVPVYGGLGQEAIGKKTDQLLAEGVFTAHDALIANTIARIMTGNGRDYGSLITEQQLLELEWEAFLALSKDPKTQQRVRSMKQTGKTIKN